MAAAIARCAWQLRGMLASPADKAALVHTRLWAYRDTFHLVAYNRASPIKATQLHALLCARCTTVRLLLRYWDDRGGTTDNDDDVMYTAFGSHAACFDALVRDETLTTRSQFEARYASIVGPREAARAQRLLLSLHAPRPDAHGAPQQGVTALYVAISETDLPLRAALQPDLDRWEAATTFWPHRWMYAVHARGERVDALADW